MNKDKFNQQFNVLIFEVEKLEHKSISELSEDITTLSLKFDAFKEQCLKELKFVERK